MSHYLLQINPTPANDVMVSFNILLVPPIWKWKGRSRLLVLRDNYVRYTKANPDMVSKTRRVNAYVSDRWVKLQLFNFYETVFNTQLSLTPEREKELTTILEKSKENFEKFTHSVQYRVGLNVDFPFLRKEKEINYIYPKRLFSDFVETMKLCCVIYGLPHIDEEFKQQPNMFLI